MSRIDLFPRQFIDSRFWKDVPTWDMVSFCETHTVHDSWFDSAIQNDDGSTTVLIQWDIHWNPTIPDQYAFLAIRFEKTYLNCWNTVSFGSIGSLEGAESVRLTAEEKAALLEDPRFNLEDYQGDDEDIAHPALANEVFNTRFDVFLGVLRILHGKNVAFATANPSGDILLLSENEIRPTTG